jgi:hypothetical protein
MKTARDTLRRHLLTLGTLSVLSTAASGAELVQPKNLIVDASLPKEKAEAQILAARRYDSFWNTGEEALAREALAADFVDRTHRPDARGAMRGRLPPRNSFGARSLI